MLRSWLIRLSILAVLVVAGYAARVAHDRVSPARVKAALVAALRAQTNDVDVHVGSARLRVFGGISVTDLRLTRRGDADPFFAAPTAVIYHDKQRLHRGELVIRKVEFDEPTIRVHRDAAGVWNVVGVFAPGTGNEPVPTVVARGGTVFVTDDGPDPIPPLLAHGVRFSLMHDPAPELRFDVHGTITLIGPTAPLSAVVAVSGHHSRADGTTAVCLDVPQFRFDKAAAGELGRYLPNAEALLGKFEADLGVCVHSTFATDGPRDVRASLTVRGGTYVPPGADWVVREINAKAHYRDDVLTIERSMARVGGATVDVGLTSRRLSDVRLDLSADPVEGVQEGLSELRLELANVVLDEPLFDRLPGDAAEVWDQFRPRGPVDIAVRFDRDSGGWTRAVTVEPKGLAIEYAKFPYPVGDVTGTVEMFRDDTGTERTRIDLAGTAGGRPIGIAGMVAGAGPDPLIDLRIAGTDAPIDDRLFRALSPKYAGELLALRAIGRGDYVAEVRQERDVNLCHNTFRVHFTGGQFSPAMIPYPLTVQTGDVTVTMTTTDPDRPLRPGLPIEPLPDTDRVELRNLRCSHGPGRVRIDGENEPVPGATGRRSVVRVRGTDCPVDADMAAAAAALGVGDGWRALAPGGDLDFAADIEVIDRGRPFDAAADLTCAVQFRGPSVTPDPFPYPLTGLAGMVRYKDGRLELGRLKAMHGPTRIGLDAAEVRFTPAGGVWANLGGFTVAPMVADDDLLAALPDRARAGLADLRPRGPMAINVGHIVVELPSTGEAAPTVYWNGELQLNGVSLDTGIAWNGLVGTVRTVGRYEGTHFGPVVGSARLDHAVVAGQPVVGAAVDFQMPPQSPIPGRPGEFAPPAVELTDLTGSLFDGTVRGTARVVLGDPPEYHLRLAAAGVRLEQLAAHYDLGDESELGGIASGELVLEQRTDGPGGPTSLTGSGRVDVPDGRMYNLPFLLPMLKLLKLEKPDQTAFEAAHAEFDVVENRVFVRHLDLIGKAISLGGSGDLTVDGRNMDFEFYTVWSQLLKRVLTGPNGGDLTSVLSGNLFKIEVTKRAGGPTKYKPQVLPAMTDPLRAAAERLRRRAGERAGIIRTSTSRR